nr:maleylpyruvate isomerase N-terminal domain-containing protein [Modestobacter sp. DSM 44400]
MGLARTHQRHVAGGPPRAGPPGDESLLDRAAERSRELTDALTRAGPTDPVWTWAPQQDVAFVLRRQAQEGTVHRVDAEQVLGRVTGIPAEVALDGLDEWLELMVPAAFPGGSRPASSRWSSVRPTPAPSASGFPTPMPLPRTP